MRPYDVVQASTTPHMMQELNLKYKLNIQISYKKKENVTFVV